MAVEEEANFQPGPRPLHVLNGVTEPTIFMRSAAKKLNYQSRRVIKAKYLDTGLIAAERIGHHWQLSLADVERAAADLDRELGRS